MKVLISMKSGRADSKSRLSAMISRGLTLALVGAGVTLQGQTVLDNFDDSTDSGTQGVWTHYAPLQTLPANSETVTWDFPADSGGNAYHIFAGAPRFADDPTTGQNTGPARAGSFRNDANYTDFSAGIDLVNWDDTIAANIGALAFRVTTPGFLTTVGYFAGFCNQLDSRDQQGILAFVEFQSELNVSGPNEFTGGSALVSRLNPTGKYRLTASATGSALRGALYNRTDLLEPIVKVGATNSDIAGPGVTGLVSVSYDSDDDKQADFTYDNFFSVSTNGPVGYPGTPQVVELVPAPQTLFYPIPGSNPITFAVRTFNNNQIATNALKMTLNGVDVTSQLALTDRAGLLDPPKANFGVRYTGALNANTIYNGQIIAVDTGGKGTTNNFVFDTFQTNGALIVEAEDYNYGGGVFQDNPPVSGLDTAGNPVNGGGNGYYGLAGVRDVDYHDTDGFSGPNTDTQNHQYRPDGTGTAQNYYTGDTPRADHLAAGVPDYYVWRMQAGEWLNYTRTFPANKWNVYLRASSQDAQAVRFDEVTGDRTAPNQTTVLRGNFLVPNTGSSTRFRYVPLTDAAGKPVVLDFSGVRTFRITPLGGFDSNRQHGGDDNGSLQPTYVLFMPVGTTPATTPWLALASPAPNTTDASPQPTAQMVILNGATSVSTSSIRLHFDGNDVTSQAAISGTTTEGPGATVTYAPPGFLMPNSMHTISVGFNDGGSGTNFSQWSFTVANLPLITPSFGLASAGTSSFNVQVAKAPNDFSSTTSPTADKDQFVNSTYRAERQLANQLFQPSTMAPYTNEAANTPTNFGFYVEPTAINYEQCGLDSGFFPGDKNFPGIYPTNYTCNPGDGPDHFAVAATIQIQLAAGVYRMGAISDDAFKVSVGTNGPPVDLILGRNESANSGTTFDFVVVTNGTYNFRIVYEEGGGGSQLEWYWINRVTGAKELVRPLQLESSVTVGGPYAAEPAAVFDPGAKTIVVSKASNTRFYRLGSSTGYTLGRPVLSGSNVLLTYQ